MPNIYFALTTALVFVVGLTAGSTASLASVSSPEVLELKTVAGLKPARFPHKKHEEHFSCGACHHSTTDAGAISPYVAGMQVRKCTTCHNGDDMRNPKFNSYKLAAHALCKGCHRQYKDRAPTTCSGCHIK